jgi:hypothetical protein
MSQPYSLEHILASAGADNAELFANIVDPEIRKRVELAQAKSAADKKTVASAWARFAASPDGRMALEALFDTTLRRTVYFVNLNQDAEAMARWGAFREGQNSVAQAIAMKIAEGQETDDKPKPRD